MGSWNEVNIGYALLWLQWEEGWVFIYLDQKDRLRLPVRVSAVGTLHVPVWLLNLFVKCFKKNPSLEKSVRYNRDRWLGRSYCRPCKALQEKKPKTQNPFYSSLSDLILSLSSHSKGQEAVAPATKLLLQPFFGISYGRIRCQTFQQ